MNAQTFMTRLDKKACAYFLVCSYQREIKELREQNRALLRIAKEAVQAEEGAIQYARSLLLKK